MGSCKALRNAELGFFYRFKDAWLVLIKQAAAVRWY